MSIPHLRFVSALAFSAAILCPSTRAQVTELETKTRVSGNDSSFDSSISADGRFVAFSSGATDVTGNPNSPGDIVVYDSTTGSLELVDVSTGGAFSDGICFHPSISSDGRFVAFESTASNLVAGDTNGFYDIFVRDRQSGTTERVSVSSGGAQQNSACFDSAISADGRFVAYWTPASNLVTGDTNDVADVFVRDRLNGTTERVSVASGGVQANGGSYSPAISADGRYVAFSSDATNLVAGDTNGARDVFVHDRQTNTTVRASVGAGGVNPNAASDLPGISSDGRYVCFQSTATNLVASDTNGFSDAFVRDLQAGTTEIASLGAGSVQGNGDSATPSISSDGRFVVFRSDASNFVAGDSNGAADIFVRDRQGATTVRASLGVGGSQGDQAARASPTISADGHRVAFASDAANLVPGDGNGIPDVFLRDLAAGTTALASGIPRSGNGPSQAPMVSDDGNLVAFQSDASNLVMGDTNGASDVFVRNRAAGTFERISVATGGGEANGSSYVPTMTPDGRFVAFASNATNLVPGDTNNTYDVFLRDRVLGTTERVSVATNGTQANGTCGFDADFPQSQGLFSLGIAITPDGRYVAFGSAASNLAPNSSFAGDAYLRDRQNGTTEVVSLPGVGGNADDSAYWPSISADGRYVAFMSWATNLVPGDTNGFIDTFVRDRQAGTTQLASVANGGGFGNGDSIFPAISGNGRYIVFASNASNLTANDTNGLWGDAFVRDLQTSTTELVDVSTAGVQADLGSGGLRISNDGRFVLLTSSATNLVAGDTNGKGDMFLRDRQMKTTTLVSVSTSGAQGNDHSGAGNMQMIPAGFSAGARYVVFSALASNFDPSDQNNTFDVYLRDRGPASAFAAFCFGDGTGAACPCANSGAAGHGCENSSTTGGAVLAGSGVASLSADSAHLTASGEKPTATSVLLQGTVTVNSLHYGDGLRCVGGTLKRLYTHNAVGGAVTMPQGADATISARSAANGDVISLGSTRIYQIYYRDPSTTFCPTPSGSTFNISNAVAIAWAE